MTLISKTGIDSGSIIYPEQILRPIEALRGEVGYDFIISGSLIVSASSIKLKTLLPNNQISAIVGYNTSSGDLYYTTSSYMPVSNSSIVSGSTSNILSFSTGSYTAGFFDFVATSTTNARAGTVFVVWNGTNLEYTEISTNDIGTTSNLTLFASLSGTNVLFQGTSTLGTWSVKTLTRMI